MNTEEEGARQLRRTLLSPMPREDDSFPKPGEIRGALDMDLLNEKARLVLVLATEETPTPWVQAVLIDTRDIPATPYDLYVSEDLSDIPFPFMVETDVTAPLLVSQLGPCIGELRQDVLDDVLSVVRTGIRPVRLWEKFGSPWVPNDPRARWKQEEIGLMGQLSTDAFRAVVEDDVVVFTDATAWQTLVSEINRSVGSDRFTALIKLANLSKFTVPYWLAGSVVELFQSLQPEEKALVRPLMEQAMRGRPMQGPREDEDREQLTDASLAYVSEWRPGCRAFVRLGSVAAKHRAVRLDLAGVSRRVQESGRTLEEFYGKAA